MNQGAGGNAGPCSAMQRINIVRPFAWAHHGYQVEQFTEGSAEVPDDCAEVAIREGWATPEAAAHAAAPETTDAAQQRRRKAAPSA